MKPEDEFRLIRPSTYWSFYFIPLRVCLEKTWIGRSHADRIED